MTSTWQERGYYEGLHTKRQGCKARRGGAGQAVLNRIAALESELAGLKAELNGRLDANRVTQGTSVTESGWAADARQMNPAYPGSIAEKVEGNAGRISALSFRFALKAEAAGNGETTDITLPSYGAYILISHHGGVWTTLEGMAYISCSPYQDAYVAEKIFGRYDFDAMEMSIDTGTRVLSVKNPCASGSNIYLYQIL